MCKAFFGGGGVREGGILNILHTYKTVYTNHLIVVSTITPSVLRLLNILVLSASPSRTYWSVNVNIYNKLDVFRNGIYWAALLNNEETIEKQEITSINFLIYAVAYWYCCDFRNWYVEWAVLWKEKVLQ